jgi:hypothetical protein
VILLASLASLASYAQTPSPPPDWIAEFPSVTEVAHAASEELKVTAQRRGIDPKDEDGIAINLAGTFVVLRQIMLLKYNEEPQMTKDREEELKKVVASYLEAELTIGRGWAGRRGYITGAPPNGLGCRDEVCYRRWFLLHLNASSGRAEYRERVLSRLFPCGTLAKELNDLRQKHATTVPYMPSPAATLRIEKELAGIAPAGCTPYGGVSRKNGLCDGWTPPPAPTAGSIASASGVATAAAISAPASTGAAASGAFRTSSLACQLPIVLTKVKLATGVGLLVSIAPESAKEGDVVTFSVSRSGAEKGVPDRPALWEKPAKLVKGSAGLQAVVAWDAGARLAPDPVRPFLIVDATSRRSSGPVYCAQPTTKWELVAHGLHGPYASVDEAALNDRASKIALGRTGTASLMGEHAPEHGFVIVTDLRRAGAYYTTPPRVSTAATKGAAPQFGIPDYKASMYSAFTSSCENIEDFDLAATVHTHPEFLGGAAPDGFSSSDFQQAIQFRAELRTFERIVLLNKGDGQTYVFIPCPGDEPAVGLLLWRTYRDRTYVPSRGEAVKGCVK